MGVQMKSLRIMVLGVMFVAALSLVGCGGATAKESAKSDNPLVGEWVGAGGNTIKFTEDVLYLDPEGTSDNAMYRYAVVDDTTINITRISEKNGVKFDDTASTRAEHYNLDGDALQMESYGDGYYRVGSPEGDKAVNNAPAVEACGKVRSTLAGGIYTAYNGNDHPTPIDDALIEKVLATGFLTTTNPEDLKCPQGGTFTWEGEDSGNLTCSVHGDM